MVFHLLFYLYLKDPFGVTLGGIIGHAICTGLAVLGGRLIAQRISVRTGKYLSSSVVLYLDCMPLSLICFALVMCLNKGM